jgi:N-acetylglutamate synthase-like GNAT family acetyltransferase
MPDSISPTIPTIRPATLTDRLYVKHLQRRFTNQIGFLPTQATEREIARGRFLLGELNHDDAGFLFLHPCLATQPTTAAIIQAAVQMDAQRHAVGTALVAQAAAQAAANGSTILQATCLESLDANLFWRDCGFIEVARKQGGTARGKQTIIWRLPLTPTAELFKLPTSLYTRAPGGKWCKMRPAPTQLPLWTPEAA